LPGVTFRAASFTPFFSKHSGKLSHGIQIHITNRNSFKPVETGLHIVKAIHDMYPEDFQFRAENSAGISFFDNLMGNGWVREAIEEGKSVEEISHKWQEELDQFNQTRKQYLLY
jgi:uncharacterized protein YbbC (DUF1343 family)